MSEKSTWRDKSWVALSVFAGVVAGLGTLAVAMAGFSLSFDASKSVAVAAHIRRDWAWMLPVSVDGAMAVAAVVAVVMRHLKGETARYPWMVVALGAAISVGCNGLHAVGARGVTLELDDARVRFAVSAIPPVMLALSVHLLVMLVELVGEVVRSKSIESPRPSIGSGTGSGREIGGANPIDRVDRIEAEESIESGDVDSTDRVDSIESGGSIDGRSDRAESTRSGGRSGGRSRGRSRARGSSRSRRTDDQLRIELAEAQRLRLVPSINPSAESIRVALQCAPDKARLLRDELKSEAPSA